MLQPLPQTSSLVVAIDGPAASGKGSLARRLAEALGAVYLDTGKLYRAVGYKLMHSKYEVHDAEDHASPAAAYAVKAAKSLNISEIDKLALDDEGVGRAASIVSAIPEVRAALLDFQRQVAASPQGAVLDGRDIGTVICPDAPVKFYITANIEARAERRYKQLKIQNEGVIYADILHDLQTRDARDKGRKTAPLQVAEDAIRIDTTNMGLEEVFAKVLEQVKAVTSEV